MVGVVENKMADMEEGRRVAAWLLRNAIFCLHTFAHSLTAGLDDIACLIVLGGGGLWRLRSS